MPVRRNAAVAACALVVLLTAGFSPVQAEPSQPDSPAAGGYRAEIRRTANGVPHVLARDVGSVAFGQAWAFAEDRLCDLADQVVKVRSERSRWFGPGENNENLASDLGYAGLELIPRARQQALRLSGMTRSAVDGYVAGYNAYLRSTGATGVKGWCAGAPWLRPITPVDLLAYQRDLALLASGRQLIPAIAAAGPPSPGTSSAEPRFRLDLATEVATGQLRDAVRGRATSTASNGWAIGRDRSATGGGMLLANPHFPWTGELRLWESHLTVPGVLDVYGASLGGVPGVQIGFNHSVAWTHTVADGHRMTLYSVPLVAGKPTTYLVDRKPEQMRAIDASIQILTPEQKLVTVRKTLWSTRYGPVLDLSAIDPALGWSTKLAVTYRDANLDNDRALEQWLAMDRSQTLEEFRSAIRRIQALPWVNTLAVDRKGTTWYVDGAATPNLSAAAIQRWSANPYGLLDGSTSDNAWQVEPGARDPGLVPLARQPSLTRSDYVFNANNSHWIANPEQPLEGFSPLQGSERTSLSVRARQNALLLAGDVPGRLTGSDDRWSVPELWDAALSDRAATSDLLLEQVVSACERKRRQSAVDEPVRSGCSVLSRWNGSFGLTSRGAVLWRELVDELLASHPAAFSAAGPVFGVDFDALDPIHTPGGFTGDPASLFEALGHAVTNLRLAGIPPDSAPEAVQYTQRGTSRIPVPGGSEQVGVLNVVWHDPEPSTTMEPTVDEPAGAGGIDLSKYSSVNNGTSFLLALAFTSRGPTCQVLLAPSQSAIATSEHFADQTWMFGEKRSRPCLFERSAIRAATESIEVVTSRGR